jgi:hypothetical protein
VTVKFEPDTAADNRHRLIIDTGSVFVSVGNSDSIITFEADTSAPDTLLSIALWEGILCRIGSIDTLKYVDIRHAYVGVEAESSAVLVLEHSSVDFCDQHGIRTAEAAVSIMYCDIERSCQ